MSKYVYEFNLNIGYHGAEWNETFDLVDDGGHDESYLDGLGRWDLQDLVYEEANDWAQRHIEISAERVDD